MSEKKFELLKDVTEKPFKRVVIKRGSIFVEDDTVDPDYWQLVEGSYYANSETLGIKDWFREIPQVKSAEDIQLTIKRALQEAFPCWSESILHSYIGKMLNAFKDNKFSIVRDEEVTEENLLELYKDIQNILGKTTLDLTSDWESLPTNIAIDIGKIFQHFTRKEIHE